MVTLESSSSVQLPQLMNTRRKFPLTDGQLICGKRVALRQRAEAKEALGLLITAASIAIGGGLHNMKSSIGHILYIEDDQDTRELVTYVLAMSNYEVVAAANYDDALLLAGTNRFDLYLCENWLSGGSGIDLCKKLREFDTWTPILFYSGAAYERDKQQAFGSGRQGYLVKPAENDELIAEVFRIFPAARRPEVAASL